MKEKAEKMWGEKFAEDLRKNPVETVRTGSSDPAKIFVQAAKGMSREEVDRITKEYVEEREASCPGGGGATSSVPEANFETIQPETVPVQYISDEEAKKDFEKNLKAERFLDFWDKWKYVMSLVPSGLFILGVIAVLSVILFGGVRDDGVTGLPFRVDYSFGFEKTNHSDVLTTPDYEKKALIENDLVAEIADGKDVDYVKIWAEEGGIGMSFKLKKDSTGDAGAGQLEYLFDEVNGGEYRVKKFKKL